MTRASLSIENLHAGYSTRPVLRGVSIPDMEPGQVVALVGPNAAGKSTVLKAIAGFLPATGRISLGAEDIISLKPFQRAGRVSYMPQSLPRGVGLNVFESIMSALRISRSRDPGIARLPLEHRATMLIERLGLEDIALSGIDTLSGGQRQMAALAQALVGEPLILLLDEPTSALDLRHQDEFMRTIREIAATGTIVIVVLHELSLAARMAERICVLSEGRIAVDGPPERAITPGILAKVWGIEADVTINARGALAIDVLGPTPEKLKKDLG